MALAELDIVVFGVTLHHPDFLVGIDVHVPTSAVRKRHKLNHLSRHIGISVIAVRRGSSISEAQAGSDADDKMEIRSSLRAKMSVRRI